jgi:DNA recombination protein RmuC
VGSDLAVILLAATVAAALTLVLVRLLGQRSPAAGAQDLLQQIGELRARLDFLLQETRQARDSIASTGHTAQSLSRVLEEVRESFARLQGLWKAREEAWEEERRQLLQSLRRVESIIAGSHGRGKAGERIVEELLAALPPEWLVRNHRVGTRVVEFAIRLPNGRLLPVDSKLPAEVVERAASAEDNPEAQQRLQSEAEKVLRQRASEVRQYLDREFSTSFALVVVPDSLYRLALAILPELARNGVIVVSYSLLLPYVLLVLHVVLESQCDIDTERLIRFLGDAERQVDSLVRRSDTSLAKAITMLQNFERELRQGLSILKQQAVSLRGQALPGSEADSSMLASPEEHGSEAVDSQSRWPAH